MMKTVSNAGSTVDRGYINLSTMHVQVKYQCKKMKSRSCEGEGNNGRGRIQEGSKEVVDVLSTQE
jgi:hypothetical protein